MTTIRQRLTTRLLILSAVLLAIGAGATWFAARTALTRQFDDSLQTKATALAALIEQDASGIQVDLGDQFMREFDTNKSSFFQLWQADGKEVARADSLQGASLTFEPNEPTFHDVRLGSGLSTRAVQMEFQPHAADAPAQTGGPHALLVVAMDRRLLDQSITTMALILTGSALGVLLLTGAAVPWLLRRELAPLRRLAAETEQITAESLSERFSTTDLPGELAPIGARLNDLLQRLEISFTRERRFSDDLAHEFRTPIAELRSLAELSLKWPDARNPETDQHVLTIARQMESIINRLLEMARSQSGTLSAELQKMDLAGLVSSVLEPMSPSIKSRQLTVSCDVPKSFAFHSDQILLRSIITNLVDNAVEYSPECGTIKITVETQNDRFVFRVTNPAGALQADDIPLLFDRFWRKDPARSGGKHAGLGLPLAHALAANLGCTLEATLHPDQYLTMTLSGPHTQTT